MPACGSTADDGTVDEAQRVAVEAVLVAAREQLRIAGHGAQRLLQVVRGDVGELLQVGVRALPARGALGDRLLGALALGDVDPHADHAGAAVDHDAPAA